MGQVIISTDCLWGIHEECEEWVCDCQCHGDAYGLTVRAFNPNRPSLSEITD